MSEITTAEGTETGTEAEQQSRTTQPELPGDHPLVKTLALQKAEIKELRGKAARLSEIEEAQKSDAEKAADRIAKAEAEVATIPAKVCSVLKPFLLELNPEIDPEKADLYLTATDPVLLMKQWAGLVELSGKRKNTNTVPREGATTESSATDEVAFARDLFGG